MNVSTPHAGRHVAVPQPMRMRAPSHRLSGEPAADRAADHAAQWALVAMQARAPAVPAADDGRCGWLDSSLDLAAGLQVIEHTDRLPDGLPLQWAA